MNFNRPPNRVPPKGPSHAYQTHSVQTPLSTHHRKATCAEVDCQAFLNGWSLHKEVLTEQDLHVARNSGRRFREVEIGPGVTHLVYEAGQPCFAAHTHTVRLDRQEFFFVGRGDWRTFSTRHATQFKRPEDFIDHFATELDKLRTERERG